MQLNNWIRLPFFTLLTLLCCTAYPKDMVEKLNVRYTHKGVFVSEDSSAYTVYALEYKSLNPVDKSIIAAFYVEDAKLRQEKKGIQIINSFFDSQQAEVKCLERKGRAYYYANISAFNKGRHSLIFIYRNNQKIKYDINYDSLSIDIGSYYSFDNNKDEFEKQEYSGELEKYSFTLPNFAKISNYALTVNDENGKEKIIHSSLYTVKRNESGNYDINIPSAILNGQKAKIEFFWPKGVVTEKKNISKKGIIKEHSDVVIAWFVFFFVLVFYAYVWNRVDGAVVNEVEASSRKFKGFTPASLLYICEGTYTPKVFSLAVLNLAKKNFIKICDEGSLYLEKQSYDDSKLSFGEKALANKLFENKDKIFYNSNDKDVLYRASVSLKENLKKEIDYSYFIFGLAYFKIGLTLSILGIFTVYCLPDQQEHVGLFFPFIMLVINALAFVLLKEPILHGDKFKACLTGFKLYLKGHPCIHSITAKSTEVKKSLAYKKSEYIDYLVYALALNVDNWWTDLYLASDLRTKEENDKTSWYVKEDFSLESLTYRDY